jgi:glycosyltransferase involved in cell wall biosynthesis
MVKVLVISYNFPPVGNVGRVRPTKLASYLPEHGWSPTVLTVSKDRTKWGQCDPAEGELPGVRVIRARFPDIVTLARDILDKVGLLDASAAPDVPGSAGELKLVPEGKPGIAQRVFNTAKRWAAFPDRYLLWIPFAFASGLRELRKGGYGVIFSTSPPVSDHFVAAALRRLTGLPWVADLRDPWSHPYLELTPTQLRLNRILEKAVLKNAAAITTVSEPMAQRMRELPGERPGGVLSILNGFDPADYSGPVDVPFDRFVVTFTGSLFGLKQDPSSLLEVADELIEQGEIGADEIVFRFYGPREPGLEALRDRLKHPEIVQEEGVVPRNEAILRQRESTALLVLLWDNPVVAGGYGGKVLEYLGARRPILAWSPAGGVIGELLHRTGAGAAVSDRTALKKVLSDWLEEFHQSGRLEYRGKEDEVERYSWVALAGQFASVLDRVSCS